MYSKMKSNYLDATLEKFSGILHSKKTFDSYIYLSLITHNLSLELI
jgi:hypothetical protein